MKTLCEKLEVILDSPRHSIRWVGKMWWRSS